MNNDHDDAHSRESPEAKPKRVTACLHCRRQKLKCDAARVRPCTRCKGEGIECVVRPRANAAILTDDLRWQQSVEARFQSIQGEINQLRALVGGTGDATAGGPSGSQNGLSSFYPARSSSPQPRAPARHPELSPYTTTPTALPHRSNSGLLPQYPLPTQLPAQQNPGELAQAIQGGPFRPAENAQWRDGPPGSLLEALARPLALLQVDRPVGVMAEEALGLWEYFYTTLAIFHGFYSGSSIASPSPLLLTSIACAACSRSMSGEARARLPLWLELFDRALLRLLAQPHPPTTWDDTVGLCIAQTWFWAPNASKAGLIAGCFFDTLTPITADVRSRRVWDFVQITILSRSVLHLSPTLIPERPPPGVPERVYPHVLFGALTELFDILAPLPRALENGSGLVPFFVASMPSPVKVLTYVELSFLRQTLDQVHRWASKWLDAIGMTSRENLPADWTRDFLLEIVNIYYRASAVIVVGYLDQQGVEEYSPLLNAARDYLGMVHEGWSSRLQCWPLMLLHVTLLGAIALGAQDHLVASIYSRLLETESFLDDTGRQLLRIVRRQHQSTSQPGTSLPLSAETLAVAMGPAGSDAFWDDLMGMFHAGPETTAPVV